MQDLEPRQRGRAELAFAGSLAKAGNRLEQLTDQRLRASLGDDSIASDYDERLKQIDAHLKNDLTHAMTTMTTDWLSRQHGVICRDAFEGLGNQFTDQLDKLDAGPTTLSAKPGFEPPEYHARHWFHNTKGGWDGHRYMGAIQAEFVHRRYVSASMVAVCVSCATTYCIGCLINALIESLSWVPRRVTTQSSWQDAFRMAELVGCDISLRMLQQARRLGNELGHAWRLLQASAEDTGLAASSFDLVTSYAIFHEIPTRITEPDLARSFSLNTA